MSSISKNFTWVFGFAAGTAAALIANRSSRKIREVSVKGTRKLIHGIRISKDRNDDSEVHYV